MRAIRIKSRQGEDQMSKIVLWTLVIAALGMAACGKKPTEAEETVDHGYTLFKVPFGQLYWNKNTLYNMISHSLCDSSGVALFEYDGQTYYHPVYIGHLCERALSDYYLSGEDKYLDYAKKSAQALVERATRSHGGLYFPYQFDYYAYEHLLEYQAPWYSGLAQGVMLSVFSRLFYLTGDPVYAAYADSTLLTFTDFDNEISTVYRTQNDSLFSGNGYYWVDEYPGETRRFVLNGSISGSFGLYDHWWVFGDDLSRQLFSQEMTSVMDHILLYRNPGNISYYCLKFKRQQKYYHGLHQTLLNQCFLYTGEFYFQAMASLFYSDHH